MAKSKFIRKKDKFIWICDNVKIEYKNPSIQAHNDYIEIEDVGDILYYYYTMSIYKNIHHYNDKNKKIDKWKLVAKTSTYDFPGILDFIELIKFMLDVDPKENGQKDIYQDKSIAYHFKLNIENWLYDDYYEITTYEHENNRWYSLYAGCAIDTQGDTETTGVLFQLEKDDLKELLTCVKSFVQYSIEKKNNEIRKYNELHLANKKIINGKLYEFSVQNNRVTTNIESIYAPGDNVDLDIKENENVIAYHRAIIKAIHDKIIIQNPISKEEKTVNVQNVVYISNNVEDEKLKYGVKEIAEEFLSILTDEKEEFQHLTVEKLLQKYKMAIIDRTWMCRDEHGFEYQGTGHPTEDIEPFVKQVIEEIKNRLK